MSDRIGKGYQPKKEEKVERLIGIDAAIADGYRRSGITDNNRKCENCLFAVLDTQHCNRYDFRYDADYVCDSHRFREGGG